MKKIIIILLTLTLAACATVGNFTLKDENKQTLAEKITVGQTTQAEILTMFGEPYFTSFTDAGNDIWSYQLGYMKADTVSYIPIVNLFGTSASGTVKELSILFDESNRVKKYNLTTSDVKTRSGVFN